MKILLINKFLYPKGGDAICTLDTGRLLVSKGHRVTYWGMQHPDNPNYRYKDFFVPYVDLNNNSGILEQLYTACNLLYSLEAKNALFNLISIEKPDIVHLHNFAHQISPAILHTIKRYRLPVVMTMHDYKLVCASYTLLSNGKPCELCAQGRYYNCLLNKCIKKSRGKSLLGTIEMYLHHRFLNIYNLVDTFISPSRFLMNKVSSMGLRKNIVYIPNFVELQADWAVNNGIGKSIIYFGRLSEEKGVELLIDAVKDMYDVHLRIVGNGPLDEYLREKIRKENIKNVHILGYMSGESLKDEVRRSLFFVLPAIWFENNPRAIIEGFSLGKPCLGARIGGISELIKDQETGITFTAGDINDLKKKIRYLVNSPERVIAMGQTARHFVETELGAEKYYERLMMVYNAVIQKYK